LFKECKSLRTEFVMFLEKDKVNEVFDVAEEAGMRKEKYKSTMGGSPWWKRRNAIGCDRTCETVAFGQLTRSENEQERGRWNCSSFNALN
jgi:hypothetical protein